MTTPGTSATPGVSGCPFSVVIPAHNEAAVIARCLEAVYRDAPADALPEVIVVANGCNDDTVAIARRVAPHATVLDLPAGSKVIAMNTGNAQATATPLFFVDADIVVDYHSLSATAEVLREPGVMAASPGYAVNLHGCDMFVRSFYKVWTTQPYIRDNLVGSGAFGISKEGREILGTFPSTFADDTWVRTRFTREQRRNVSHDREGRPVSFKVSPPQTLFDHIRIEARRRIGSEQVNKLYGNSETGAINRVGDLKTALREGAGPIDVAIYLGMKAAARMLFKWKAARGKNQVWARDLKSRTG